MTTIPTLRALLEKAIRAHAAYLEQIEGEPGYEPAFYARLSAGEELSDAAINALPQLLAIAEAAQARQAFAKEFSCVAHTHVIARPRHQAWDHLETLDDRLNAALAALSPTQPEASK